MTDPYMFYIFPRDPSSVSIPFFFELYFRTTSSAFINWISQFNSKDSFKEKYRAMFLRTKNKIIDSILYLKKPGLLCKINICYIISNCVRKS